MLDGTICGWLVENIQSISPNVVESFTFSSISLLDPRRSLVSDWIAESSNTNVHMDSIQAIHMTSLSQSKNEYQMMTTDASGATLIWVSLVLEKKSINTMATRRH
jgi:hypothetical protein